MKADHAFNTSVVSDITPALLAIGRDSFAEALIDTLRRVAGVGHCMVFSFTGPRSAACLLDVGNIPTGRDLGIAYSEHFHQADPNRDAVFEGQATIPTSSTSSLPRSGPATPASTSISTRSPRKGASAARRSRASPQWRPR
jgi:hypothetical protein